MFKLPLKLKKREFPTTFAVADIGTNAVKCLIFQYDDQNKTLELKGANKQSLEQGVVRSGNIVDLDKTAVALDEALYRAGEGLDIQPDHIIFGVSGDLCISLVTTVRVTRPKPEPILQKEIDEVNDKTIDSAYSEAHDLLLKNKGDIETELALITKANVYTKLDNDYIHKLEGESGTKIETATYTAFSPEYHLNHLQELASLMKMDILAITSNLYSITEVIKRKNKVVDGIIIDVGSSSTQVGIVFGGGLVASKSLSIGGSHFTKKLSRDFNLTLAEAEKLKYEYLVGNLQDSDIIKIESSLTDVANTWLEGLEIVFGEFEGVKTFASDIYLTGGGSKVPVLNDALETKPWTKSIPFKKPPEFNKINAQNLDFIKDITGILEHSEFVVPATLSVIYLEMLKQK